MSSSAIRDKEKFVFNLLNPGDRAGKTTLLYIVFKTIESNSNISLNQLRWLLDTEYLIPNDAVSGAVASLTSKSLFNCVSRWQPAKGGRAAAGAVHLRVRTPLELEFQKWYNAALEEFPEFRVFVPPIFTGRQASAPVQQPQHTTTNES